MGTVYYEVYYWVSFLAIVVTNHDTITNITNVHNVKVVPMRVVRS